MKPEKIISRRKAINNELKEIKKREHQLENKEKYLTNVCNHEIIIKNHYESKLIDGRQIDDTHCFYCHEYLGIRKYVPKNLLEKIKKAIYIDISEMEDKISTASLEDMYFSLKAKYPKATEYEIGQMMKEQIEKK